MEGGASRRRPLMTDHSRKELLVFAMATDERGLFVFANESEATSYCEGLDVEAGGWFFWNSGGVPLEPEFLMPNTRGRFSVGNGRYRLIRAAPDHHADLAGMLDGMALLEPNPFFASVAEVKAHLAGRGGRTSAPEDAGESWNADGARVPSGHGQFPGNGHGQGHGEHDANGFQRRRRELMAPRWLEICVGLALMPFTLMCLAGSVMMIAWPAKKAPNLSIALGLVFVLVCLWILAVSVRLVLNRPRQGGLLGPFALRASAVLFFALPIGGLFTGHYRAFGLVAIGQAICYLLVAGKLWSLAGQRARRTR